MEKTKAYHHEILDIKEDAKNFWGGKSHILFIRPFLQSRSFLFAKPQINKILFIRQWLKCSELEETHISQKGALQQNPVIFYSR